MHHTYNKCCHQLSIFSDAVCTSSAPRRPRGTTQIVYTQRLEILGSFVVLTLANVEATRASPTSLRSESLAHVRLCQLPDPSQFPHARAIPPPNLLAG